MAWLLHRRVRKTCQVTFSMGFCVGKLLFAVMEYSNVMTHVKAISLLSGGLDSILATELIRRQGIEVITFNVKTPFGIPKKDGTSEAAQAADQLKVPLKVVTRRNRLLEDAAKPKTWLRQKPKPMCRLQNLHIKKSKKIRQRNRRRLPLYRRSFR